MTSQTEWYQDNFLVSTSPSLLQLSAINAAFGSDFIYWTRAIDEKLLMKMLAKSLCFGVYELPTSTADIAGRRSLRQIGLARIITDEVSIAYLTDVYILPEHQGRGLGKWLIECVNQTLSSWPELRRLLLITSSGKEFYADNLNVRPFEQGKNGMFILSRKGEGSTLKE